MELSRPKVNLVKLNIKRSRNGPHLVLACFLCVHGKLFWSAFIPWFLHLRRVLLTFLVSFGVIFGFYVLLEGFFAVLCFSFFILSTFLLQYGIFLCITAHFFHHGSFLGIFGVCFAFLVHFCLFFPSFGFFCEFNL